MNLEQPFEDLGGFQQTAALHLLCVLLEPYFPIGVRNATSVGQVRKHTRDLPVLGYPAKTDIGCVGKRNQHRHAVVTESKQIKPLKRSSKRAGADVFDRPNPLVGYTTLSPIWKVIRGPPQTTVI